MKELNILLTSVGRRSYLVEYFKEALNGVGQVHVANSSELSPAFRVADHAIVTPLIYDKEYIPFLKKYCIENHISAIISLFDIDLPVLAQHKEEFKQIGVTVIVSDYSTVEVCNDKWNTFNFLKKNGFNVPKTYISIDTVLEDISQGNVSYPLMIKPRWGMGSIAVFEAENEEELIVFYKKAKRNIERTYLKYESAEDINNSILIQEKIDGQEYGLDIINDLDGNYVNTVVKMKYAMRSGETDCAVTVDNPELKKIGEKLSKVMQHIGNLDTDIFILDGKCYVLEMNARFGGGYPFSHMAGVNLPLAIIKWLQKEVVEKNVLTERVNVMSQKDINLVRLYLKNNINNIKGKENGNKILVTRSSMPQMDEYIDEIKDIWETHWLTNMGSKHKRLQEELLKYLEAEQIDLFTNGHMAIELSLQAMNLPKNSEVITTPFTFASTTHAIVRNGLEPVFCDINPIDFTMDVTKIERLITDRTSAIMPVHVYGNVCNIEEIQRIADKYGLKVIYDAAHTFGVRYKDQGIASFGDVSCFSFHATKVFNTIEGGAACFKNKDFGLDLYRLKNFGIRGPETVDGVGANAKMNEFCAAMGLCNIRHVDDEIAKRKAVVERYVERLSEAEGIQLNPVQKDVKPNYAYFPAVFDEKVFGASRNEVFEALAKEGIGARKYFYPLTNTFDCFHGKYDPNLTPVALHISKRVLTLPLYADLPLEDVDRICNIILSCKR